MNTSETSAKSASPTLSYLRKFPGILLSDTPGENVLLPLFLVSFAALYVEILLIRWIGTEVRIFAYFQNLSLIASFLGFGLGCYGAGKKRVRLFDAAALGALVILVVPGIPGWRRTLEVLAAGMAFSADATIWTLYPGEERLGSIAALSFLSVCLMAVFLLLMIATMLPLGRWVGTYLNAAKNPISAYTANLAGSLAGIWLLAALAYLHFSPVVWYGVALLLYVAMRREGDKLINGGTIVLIASLIFLYHAYAPTKTTATYWTPYQKLTVESLPDDQYQINVNNAGYMSIANVSPSFLLKHPEFAQGVSKSSYDAPFRFITDRDRVLIVGGGAGNDAAAALRNGARQVDVVEIDPVIYGLGKRLHPDHPYDSPKVHVILYDARAYLRQSTQSYDAIIFGLLDSHTQFSGYSSMRIDNYVYTEEAFREAKRLLKPSGVLVLKFEVREPWTWMGERFQTILGGLFNRPPVVFTTQSVGGLFSATEFLASDDPQFWAKAEQPDLASLRAENPPVFPASPIAPSKTTDDWPYVYQRSHTIPRTYLTVSMILLVLAILLVRKELFVTSANTWNFFFLGAGFLLMETQLISRLALYFGSTWLVNCVALSAILVVLMLANFYVQFRAPGRLQPYYIALVASLMAIYLIPWEQLPFGSRNLGTLLTLAYCFPLFFAGIIFTETFRRSADRSKAFGSNIVGSVSGGLIQNISFVVGLKALILIAAILYMAAAILHRNEFLRSSDRDSLARTSATSRKKEFEDVTVAES